MEVPDPPERNLKMKILVQRKFEKESCLETKDLTTLIESLPKVWDKYFNEAFIRENNKI